MRAQPIKTVLLAALLGGGRASAGPESPKIEHPDAIEVDRIKVGLERAKVIGMLGPPQKTATGGATESLFYTLPRPMKPYSYSPIAIANGRVVGTGQAHYGSGAEAR